MIVSLIILLIIIAIVTKRHRLKSACFAFAVIGSIVVLVVGAATWPYQLLGLGIWWFLAWIVGNIILFCMNRKKNNDSENDIS